MLTHSVLAIYQREICQATYARSDITECFTVPLAHRHTPVVQEPVMSNPARILDLIPDRFYCALLNHDLHIHNLVTS